MWPFGVLELKGRRGGNGSKSKTDDMTGQYNNR